MATETVRWWRLGDGFGMSTERRNDEGLVSVRTNPMPNGAVEITREELVEGLRDLRYRSHDREVARRDLARGKIKKEKEKRAKKVKELKEAGISAELAEELVPQVPEPPLDTPIPTEAEQTAFYTIMYGLNEDEIAYITSPLED